MRSTEQDNPFIIFATFFACFLLFFNIDNYYMGMDEGDYPTHALNILKYGVPQTEGHFFNPILTVDGVWAYHPWLGMYLTAFSILILGQTTLAAKLFPILAFVFAIFQIYRLAYRLSEDNKDIARLTVLFFICSVPLILYSRSTRHYSYALFFYPLIINYYLDFLEKGKHALIKFCVGSILFFYACFVQFFGLMLGIGIHFLLFYLMDRKLLFSFFKGAFVIAVFTLPWLIHFPIQIKTNLDKFIQIYFMDNAGKDIFADNHFVWTIKFILGCLAEINSYVFPAVLAIFLLKWFIRPLSNKIHVIPIVIISLYLVGTVHNGPGMENTTGAASLFLFLLALACIEIKRKFNLPVFAGVVSLLLLTNFIHVIPWYAIKVSDSFFSLRERFSPESYISESVLRRSISNARLQFIFINYLQELFHEYDSSLKAITSYINEHKKPTDTFLAAHEEMEVGYYTNLKPAVAFPFNRPPAWIIPRKNYRLNPYKKIEPREVSIERHRKILDYVKNNNYKEIVLDSIDMGFENSTNIQVHKFKKPKTGVPVVIYHKETAS
ncbi:MAG: hypothetical protein VYC17_00880 [Nitrospinota bacterium]|nr:hypothetical protein [Nitrospinota bacterium]